MPLYEVVSTPNPDSLKFAAHGFSFVDSGMISARVIEEANGHGLAMELCQADGVANVFILPEFMTVTKHADASWDRLLPVIETLIQEHYAADKQRRN